MPERNLASFQFLHELPYQPENPTQFSLRIRQQPEQTRLSTGNERERRVIEPPPIIQISLNDVSPEHECNWLQNPYYFMCVNLVHPSDDSRVYTPHHPALAGQIVSAMYRLKDVNNQDGGFFVFGDLSVKAEGQFRLKFTLFKMRDTKVINIMSVISYPFITYTAKAYPGAMEPTFLSRAFYDQGARIRIRKENSLHVTQKRKAQCEATNNRHTEYPMTSPERYPHTSPRASPPSSHSPREAVFSSMFLPMEGCSMIGKQLSPDIRYKRNDANWQSTVWIPTSAPLSPFPSPPHYSLHEPTSSTLARNHLPILPPLRNLPPSSGSSTLPTAHALFPSSNPYPRHIA